MTHNLPSLAGIALAATFSFGTMAEAAPVSFSQDFVKNYGTDFGAAGTPTYGGVGLTGSNYVTVRDSNDNAGNRFFDTISFAGLVYDSISSITLTLDYADAGAGSIWSEKWLTFVPSGFTPGGALDTSSATRITLGTLIGTGSVTFSVTGNALSTALTAETLGFWFGEDSWGNDSFKLTSATLTVNGQAPSPVPLPAAGFLLLGAIGGLAALRRRNGKADA